MKAQYNREDDVLMIHLSDEPIDHAEEAGGIIVHFSRENGAVLPEVLDASDLVARPAKITATAPSGDLVAM